MNLKDIAGLLEEKGLTGLLDGKEIEEKLDVRNLAAFLAEKLTGDKNAAPAASDTPAAPEASDTPAAPAAPQEPSQTGNPLEPLLTDGGYVGIFRTIACIGDSLSSGEFEGTDENGNKTYHDMYEYSWGQYIARTAGCRVYNFSRGGMSAKEYIDSFADDRGLWNRDLAAQAYIMALGVNDISAVLAGDLEMGSTDDINAADRRLNKRTFAGCYAAILQRCREIAPDSFFFLMTIPRSGDDNEREKLNDRHRELLLGLADMFPNVFVLDLRKYAPVYDEAFRSRFFLGGHMNPMGYLYTARMTMTYIDSIIRGDMRRFAQTGFINTPWKNAEK